MQPELLQEWHKSFSAQLARLDDDAADLALEIPPTDIEEIKTQLEFPDGCESLDDAIAYLQLCRALVDGGPERIQVEDHTLFLLVEVEGVDDTTGWEDGDDEAHELAVDEEVMR